MDQQSQSSSAAIPVSASPLPQVPVSSPPPVSPSVPVNPPPVEPPVKSSHTKFIIMLVIFFLLVAAGVAFWQFSLSKSESNYPQITITPMPSPTVTPSPSPTIGAVKSGDAQLDAQSETIDTNMKQLDSDVKGVDSGLQDQSVDLSQ